MSKSKQRLVTNASDLPQISKKVGMSGVSQASRAAERIPNYKKTRTYEALDAAGRRSLAACVRESGIDDELLFYLLYKNDLLHMVTKDERKKANQGAEFFVVIAIVVVLAAISAQQPIAIFIATGFLFFAAVLYFTGLTNSYSQALRQVKRKLKVMPTADRFDAWLKEHSIQIDDAAENEA